MAPAPRQMTLPKVPMNDDSSACRTVKRFENPHTYYVDLSQKLFDIKQDLLCRSR